jgi:hypothetical protein
MSDETHTPDAAMVMFSLEQQIPPLSREQLEGLLRWSLMRLPHRVDTIATGDAIIHLNSGRSVRLTPAVRDDGDSVHLDVTVHEIDERDIPEMMAVHELVINTTLLASTVLWAHQRAGV